VLHSAGSCNGMPKDISGNGGRVAGRYALSPVRRSGEAGGRPWENAPGIGVTADICN
jgi:hypothetical protein